MSNLSKLKEVLEKRFGPIKVTGNGWIRIKCPTCREKDSRKYKRYIHPDNATTNCFICGVRKEVQEFLKGEYMPVFTERKEKPEEERKVDPRALELPCHYYYRINDLPDDHPAIKFLHKDFLFDVDQYWDEYGIMYVPASAGKVFKQLNPHITSAERIVFPIFFGGKMVGWQMRSIPGTFYGDRPDVVKYYHLFDKGSYVFNYDKAKQYDEVIVVEGIKKALKFPNAVATWGSGISPKQLQIIQEWPRIVMMLDGEDRKGSQHIGTQEKAIEIVKSIKLACPDKQVINIDLRNYNAKSPDELPAKELHEIVKEEWHGQRGL